MKIQNKSILLLAGTVVAGCGGLGGGSQTPVVYQTLAGRWDETLMQAVRDNSIGPPATARAIGVVHTAMFDAWAAYDSKAVGVQWGSNLRRPVGERTLANKEKAISYAAYRTILDLFPKQKAKLDAEMSALGYDPALSGSTSDPAGIGNTCAKAVTDMRHNDGSNQLGNLHPGAYTDYTGYAPVNTVDTVNDPNHWQPIRFTNGKTPGFIAPHWGNVKTFAVPNVAALRPGPPAQYGTTAYAKQAQEVLDYTANLTDTQKVIAEYWANGPTTDLAPGHWCLFGQWVSRRDHHTLDDDVKMFFMLGNAMLDSSVCCWDIKRHYDYVRPITAIRVLYAGQSVKSWNGTVQGENWVPYQPGTFITPPFAEYVSGHSTFSAAGAEILKRFTKSDACGFFVTIQPGTSAVEPGKTPKQAVSLSWPTFTAAADEAGISRRYGGIHFVDGDLKARALGRTIGGLVYDKAMSYINGTPGP